jgi:hypothetical protein
MVPQINTSNVFSGCIIDHAPKGRNRNRYIAMQRWISTKYGDYGKADNLDVAWANPGDYAVDVSCLPDDVIIRVQRISCRLRKTDR